MKLRTKTFNKYGEKYQIKYHEFTDKSGDNMISYTITDGEYDTFSNR